MRAIGLGQDEAGREAFMSSIEVLIEEEDETGSPGPQWSEKDIQYSAGKCR